MKRLSIKRETLRSWAHDIHHVKRAKRRRTRVRKYRERMGLPGLMLQMDGSPHRWFGDEKSCLIAIIDDATSDRGLRCNGTKNYDKEFVAAPTFTLKM